MLWKELTLLSVISLAGTTPVTAASFQHGIAIVDRSDCPVDESRRNSLQLVLEATVGRMIVNTSLLAAVRSGAETDSPLGLTVRFLQQFESSLRKTLTRHPWPTASPCQLDIELMLFDRNYEPVIQHSDLLTLIKRIAAGTIWHVLKLSGTSEQEIFGQHALVDAALVGADGNDPKLYQAAHRAKIQLAELGFTWLPTYFRLRTRLQGQDARPQVEFVLLPGPISQELPPNPNRKPGIEAKSVSFAPSVAEGQHSSVMVSYQAGQGNREPSSITVTFGRSTDDVRRIRNCFTKPPLKACDDDGKQATSDRFPLIDAFFRPEEITIEGVGSGAKNLVLRFLSRYKVLRVLPNELAYSVQRSGSLDLDQKNSTFLVFLGQGNEAVRLDRGYSVFGFDVFDHVLKSPIANRIEKATLRALKQADQKHDLDAAHVLPTSGVLVQ